MVSLGPDCPGNIALDCTAALRPDSADRDPADRDPADGETADRETAELEPNRDPDRDSGAIDLRPMPTMA